MIVRIIVRAEQIRLMKKARYLSQSTIFLKAKVENHRSSGPPVPSNPSFLPNVKSPSRIRSPEVLSGSGLHL